MDRIADIPAAIWSVVLAAAPWLLFGLVLSGVIRAWLPDHLVARWLGGRGLGAVIRAAIIGTPLPLCSCGVVPTAIGLRRQGASKAATVSFLVATPENGADSIALTYALMGPVMAIARPVAALISAVVAGALALFLGREDDSADQGGATPGAPAGDCACGDASRAPAPKSDCCDMPSARPDASGPLHRLADGIRYAFTTLLDDLVPWLVVGLVLAGVLTALVPPDAMAQWGRGPLAMLVMALIGVPIYVCATAFTPVGASLILAGVSPGAVLVLLLAGPATNIGTIGIVKRELGTPTLIAYLAGVIAVAIACGLGLDAIVTGASIPIRDQAASAHELLPPVVSIGAAALLTLIAIRPFRRAVAALATRHPTSTHAPEHHP